LTRRRRRRSILPKLFAVAAVAALVGVYFWREKESVRPATGREAPSTAATPAPLPRPSPKAAPTARPGSLPFDFESAGEKARPVLALVLDDVGFDEDALRRLAAVDGPLALAVIPNAPHAREAAALASKKGWDLLVHLPMSGADGAPAEPDAIGSADDDATIAARVARAIDAVPGAKGLNNHQGSRATADPRVVRAMLEVVGSHGLFFLDSRTTAGTVAENEARRLGIPTIARDVFLDDEKTEAEAGGAQAGLEASWRAALAKARKKGSCVLIAHPRKETLDFLAPKLAAGGTAGLTRVKVSELAD
jgi:uncharacterized protein